MIDEGKNHLTKQANGNDRLVGWCIIPAHIVADKKLSANEKIVLGRIYGLSDKEGYCFASNSWLGEQLGISKGTVANIISKLVKNGYVKREIIRDDKNVIIQRRLTPLWNGHLLTKELTPIHQTVNTPIHQTVKYSNRDNSKEISKRKSKKESPNGLNSPLKEKLEKLLTKFNELYETKYRLTDGRLRKLKTRLKTFTLEEIKQALQNMATAEWTHGKNERGWMADPDYLLRSDETIDKWLSQEPEVEFDWNKMSPALARALMVAEAVRTSNNQNAEIRFDKRLVFRKKTDDVLDEQTGKTVPIGQFIKHMLKLNKEVIKKGDLK